MLVKLKRDLTSLKAEVGKIDVDEIEIVRAEISILRNVVKIDIIKNTVHDELVTKINNSID